MNALVSDLVIVLSLEFVNYFIFASKLLIHNLPRREFKYNFAKNEEQLACCQT